MSKSKVIVVIGAGFFGVWCANKLSRTKKNYTIKLITNSDYTYFLISSPRVAVENDTNRTIYPLSEIVNEEVDIVKDDVVLIKEQCIELKEGGEVQFDSLIIATGAKWPDPIGYTHHFCNDYKSYFQREHDKIESAKHIVLIGGGYNNAELAGEFHDRYKEQLKKGTKKITIIQSGEYMLPNDGFYCEKLRKRVTEFFQNETDIELILNTRAEFSDADPNHVLIGNRVIQADLIYHFTGVEASVPPNNFVDFTDKQGFIKVHETLQCVGASRGNVFAIGDCTDFKYKGLVLRRDWMGTILHNVQQILDGAHTSAVQESNLKKSKRPDYHVTTIVSLGAHAGCGQVGFSFIPWTFMMPEFICRLQKSRDMVRGYSKYFLQNG